MNKLILSAAAVGLAGYIAFAGLAGAQGVPDLGVENVGLLPSNPFYFLKEWGRGVRTFFTGNAIRKAELALEVFNEKAAEIKTLDHITPGNLNALINAANSYKEAADRLRIRLEAVKDNSSNPNVDRLLGQLADRSLRHWKLFEDLQNKFVSEAEVRAAIADLNGAVVGVLSVIPGELDEPGNFRRRFEEAVAAQNDDFRELRGAELADRLEERVGDDAKAAVAGLKEDLLIGFSGRLQGLELSDAVLPEGIESLSGDRLRILRLLDEVRELTADSDTRNSLNVIRQRILDRAAEENGIGPEVVTQAIESAQALIAEVEAKIGSREMAVRASVKELVSRAKFNLAQAERFFQDENYGAAYGQATAAYATAKNAWVQLVPSVFDQSQSLDYLKQYYDELVTRAQDAELDSDNNPKIFSLLAEAERKIVALNKLLEGSASPEAGASALKSVKLILATVEELIRAAVNTPVLKVEEATPAQIVVPDNAVNQPANSLLNIPESATVVISANSFDPPALKVKVGTKVTWFNKDIRPHWPATDLHPTHQLLPGFDSLNGLSQGETYSFVFEKAGVWKYHDHLNPSLVGVVEVAE